MQSGSLTVEVSKWLGLSSDRICSLDLASVEGRAALHRLTAGAAPGSPQATPLGALIEYLKDCRTLEEVRSRCSVLGEARAA